MSPILKKIQVVLASASPRRKHLLENAGIDLIVAPSQIDEESICADKAYKPYEYVKILARAKADSISLQYQENWVIGADSVVIIDDEILNKPASPSDARRMISRLSGRTHRVLTGYCIINRSLSHFYSDVEATEVTFKNLQRDEIEWYTETAEPYDKAGGYAIQGIGAFMIKRINGSYTNVVGLPLSEVMDHLAAHGAIQYQEGPPEPQNVAGNPKDGRS